MKTDDHLIGKVFDAEVQFAVPRFQRGYVWEQVEHWGPLWEEVEDISRRVREEEQVEPYYLGAIVVEPRRATGFRPQQYEVVDGQQRLTTLQILFAAFRDVGVEYQFPKQAFLNAITENARVERSTDQFKVWPTDADQEVFSLILRSDRGNEVEKRWPKRAGGAGRIPRPRLVEAYGYFRKQILDYATTDDSRLAVSREETWKRLELLLLVLREKLHIVSIELGEQDDPMMIFEALNGRHRPLLPSDLIKNFALRRSAERDIERLYTTYWEPFDKEREDDGAAPFWKHEQKRGRLLRSRIDLFLTDFIRCRRSPEMKDADLFKEFKTWWERDSNELTPEERFSIIREDASAYRKLIAPNPVSREPLAEFCVHLQFMDITVMHPLLLRLAQALGDGRLGGDELPRILQVLESFLVRRHVCDLTKKKHNHVMATLIKTVNRLLADESAILECSDISEALLALDGPSVEWPDDGKFHRAWLDQPLYRQPPTGFVKVILSRIDRWERRKYDERGVTIDYSKMTIEHVLPQGWRENSPLPPGARPGQYRGEDETAEACRDRMMQTIGNLTLLGQPLNSAMSNSAFERKRTALTAQNSVRLNAYFIDAPPIWEEASIQQRSEALFKIAKQIWPFPLDDSAAVLAIPEATASRAEGARAQHSMSDSGVPRSLSVAHDDAVAGSAAAFEIPQDAPPGSFTKNPYRGPGYKATVEALYALGIGRMHDFDSILRAVRETMGPQRWKVFEEKPARPNSKTGKGADERVIQNVSVLARRDYGEPLRNQGYEIRYDGRQEKAGLFELK